MKLWRRFFPTNVCFLMWSIKWVSVNKLTRKTPFCDKISFVGMSVYTTGVKCVTFVLWRLTSYFLVLKIFYLSLFACLSLWAPSCFPEVTPPSYGPGREVFTKLINFSLTSFHFSFNITFLSICPKETWMKTV